VKRSHSMPFGGEVQADGGIRFRLWAPQARSVHLRLEPPSGENKFIHMEDGGDGWYHVSTDEAYSGTLYRYQIDRDFLVPDPASRYQPEDVHGPSEVISAAEFDWDDGAWRGRRWEETILYEIHVGTFTSEGTFMAAAARLDYLVDLGVTAVELMPVADFPGARNWGYDGVLLFAPDSSYGRPEDLKHFVQTAHQKGLMVFLDVVYNHFGPEGNYLYIYAKSFFTERHQTPWGAAINFDGPESRTVRDFFIHNALYWLEEYHLDGLRIDAAHAIRDDSEPDILEELAQEVLRGPGAKRHVHLMLENDHNAAKYLIRDAYGTPTLFTAQWNDDIHHSLHCLVTGESAGYYGDYSDRPAYFLGKCLAEGFAYQGEPSKYRGGASRGEPSKDLPPTAFVSFLQNHDQVGNRAFGDRITVIAEGRALRVAATILLMAPSPPLIFMAEELGCLHPFLFFCDFSSDLAASVTEGRRREFAKFPEFKDPSARKRIPDPNHVETFNRSKIDWNCLEEASHQKWLSYYRKLLGLRHRQIVPRLKGIRERKSNFGLVHGNILEARWTLGDGSQLTLVANLGEQTGPPMDLPESSVLVETEEGTVRRQTLEGIPPWYAAWFLQLHRGEKK
jgi:maltooligosyltrehalose trehalohydrolase